MDETTGTSLVDSAVAYNTTYHYSLFYEDASGELVLLSSLTVTTKTHEQAMMDLISGIRAYGREHNSNFLAIPMNALELLTTDHSSGGGVNNSFTNGIDGIMQSSVYFGPTNNNPQSVASSNAFQVFLDLQKAPIFCFSTRLLF